MNSADYVDNLKAELKQSGKSLSEVSFEVAKACVGWAYVFGAKGQYCTPSYRRSAYKSHSDHETIKTACKNFDGNGSCSGCKWYPNGKRTREGLRRGEGKGNGLLRFLSVDRHPQAACALHIQKHAALVRF